jgi:hypothetical protein
MLAIHGLLAGHSLLAGNNLFASHRVLAVLGLLGLVAIAPEDPQVAAAKERYRSALWPKGERRAGLALGALAAPGYVGGNLQLSPEAGSVVRRFADPAGQSGWMVEASVRESAAQAHDLLAGQLAFVTSPDLVPTAESSGVAVGEIGYVGFAGTGRTRISWIAFARGNVYVRLNCLDPAGSPHPDMGALAKLVDGAILASPAVAAGASVSRPRIARFSMEKAACVAGEKLPVDLEVSDPAGAPALEWVVGGPGQGYLEKDGSGRFVLHTTGPGRIELTVHAAGANGALASATTKLDVAKR